MARGDDGEERVRLWFEDMPVGRRFTSGKHRVEREEVIAFAARYDPQPYHLDDAAAAANPIFGRLSASGLHTMAMASRLVHDLFVRDGIHPVAGGGLDEWRLILPVFPDDVLRVEPEVVEAHPLATRPGLGLIKFRTTVLNQNSATVMAYVGILFMERRPVADPDPQTGDAE